MNILVIHNYYQYRGGEDRIFETEKKLLEVNGHKVFSLSAHNNSVKDIFFSRKQVYTELEKILSNNSIDVAHIHNVYHIIGNEIYKKLSEKNIPIIQTLHNFRFLCPAGLMMDNRHQICELCKEGNFSPCVTKKCYQNSYVKSFIMTKLVKDGRDKVKRYVTKFVPQNTFYAQKYVEAGFVEEKMAIKTNFLFEEKQQLVDSTSEPYALFIGRLSPEKGVELILDAFRDIPFKVKIVGTGTDDYTALLKEKSVGMNNVEFCGFASGEQKDKLLRQSSFLIVPSIWYENCPMTIMEGYSFGKPVIAARIAGLPAIVEEGISGFLFEPNNSKSLKTMILKMIDNQVYIPLSESAYRHFKNNFTDKQNYIQLIRIYQDAIAEKSKRL